VRGIAVIILSTSVEAEVVTVIQDYYIYTLQLGIPVDVHFESYKVPHCVSFWYFIAVDTISVWSP